MAIALVQTATQVNVGGSSTTAPSITINSTTGGNCLVAFAGIWDANNTWTITSTTDGGNTFTTRSARADGGTGSESKAIASHAVNITGGNRTVAFNLSGTSGGSNRYYVLGCLEFSGVATSTPEDTWDANETIDTSGGTDISAGPITTTDAGDVIVGCASNETTSSSFNWASPASWTNSYRQNDSFNFSAMDAGYWLPGATQTNYTAQWSHNNNGGDVGGGVMVALKPAAGGGTATNPGWMNSRGGWW